MPIPELDKSELEGGEESDGFTDEAIEGVAYLMKRLTPDLQSSLLEWFNEQEPCPSTVSQLCGLIEEALPKLAHSLRYKFGVTDHM